MKNVSIAQYEFHVQQIRSVIKNNMTRAVIPMRINGRYSDAFIYIIEGTTIYTISDGEKMTATAGDLLYLSKGSRYAMDVTTENYDFIFVDFDFEDAPMRKCQVFTPRYQAEPHNLLFRMKTCQDVQPVGFRAEMMSILYQLYAIAQKSTGKKLSKENENRLLDADAYILEHYLGEPIPVSALAAVAGISEGHLRRLFHTHYGISPGQYILNLKTEHAKSLMQYRAYTLSEIAELSGFGSVYYFSKVFRQSTGKTASAYRAELDET